MHKHQIAAYIFAAIVPTVPQFSQAIAHIVNFYLHADRKTAREEIVRLAGSHDSADKVKVMDFVREALRKLPQFARLMYASPDFSKQDLTLL